MSWFHQPMPKAFAAGWRRIHRQGGATVFSLIPEEEGTDRFRLEVGGDVQGWLSLDSHNIIHIELARTIQVSVKALRELLKDVLA